jgi:hypothetical protein
MPNIWAATLFLVLRINDFIIIIIITTRTMFFVLKIISTLVFKIAAFFMLDKRTLRPSNHNKYSYFQPKVLASSNVLKHCCLLSVSKIHISKQHK